jgi:hypothetical protein
VCVHSAVTTSSENEREREREKETRHQFEKNQNGSYIHLLYNIILLFNCTSRHCPQVSVAIVMTKIENIRFDLTTILDQ